MTPRPHVTARPLRWEDFPDVRETYFQLYDERDTGESVGVTLATTRPSLADEVSWFERTFRRALDGDLVAVAGEVDGHAVGLCTIDRHGSGPRSEVAHVGELGLLVRRGYRGQGIGTALLERALAEARSRFDVVYLNVFSVNEGAQRLYRRFGFAVCGHLPRSVKRNGRYYDLERMVLDFSSTRGNGGANR